MRNYLRTLSIALCLLGAMIAGSCRGQSASVTGKTKGWIKFVATEAVAHPDDNLLRLHGRLIGTPNTSNRIDRAMLVNGNDTIVANDIDGIDFRRYFQWEDDGEIVLEIDFPAKGGQPIPKCDANSIIIFETAKGVKSFKTTGLKKNTNKK